MDAKIASSKVLREETQALMNKLMGKIGNIVHDKVPVFQDEKHNKVVRTWGEKR